MNDAPFRRAAFDWLAAQVDLHGEVLPRPLLRACTIVESCCRERKDSGPRGNCWRNALSNSESPCEPPGDQSTDGYDTSGRTVSFALARCHGC